jgi:hypothetical protein
MYVKLAELTFCNHCHSRAPLSPAPVIPLAAGIGKLKITSSWIISNFMHYARVINILPKKCKEESNIFRAPSQHVGSLEAHEDETLGEWRSAAENKRSPRMPGSKVVMWRE